MKRFVMNHVLTCIFYLYFLLCSLVDNQCHMKSLKVCYYTMCIISKIICCVSLNLQMHHDNKHQIHTLYFSHDDLDMICIISLDLYLIWILNFSLNSLMYRSFKSVKQNCSKKRNWDEKESEHKHIK